MLTQRMRNDLEQMHRSAMRWSYIADQSSGDRARRCNRIAARLERQVAKWLPLDLEPSRSIILRSSATLFLRAGENDLAMQAADDALSQSPPPEIVTELRRVLNEAVASHG